jgi:polysaccharide pyruvyl transferase WcaK-like protein
VKVTVLGWYGHSNVGDDAFLEAFPIVLPGHELRFVETIPRGDDSDAYILGGGDVFYQPFTDQLRRVPADRPKVAASVTLTGHSDFSAYDLFSHVYVRDQMSLEHGRAVAPDKTSYLPDVTFALTPDPVAGRAWMVERFASEGLELFEKVVVCVLSSYAGGNKFDSLARDYLNFQSLAMQVAEIADSTTASFVFLPFGTRPPYDDRATNAWVSERTKYWQKNYAVHDRLGVQATIDILAASDAVVSSRLHSTIFSVVAGVPFVDLTHHDKNLGFVRTVGKPEWSMPLWKFGPQQIGGLLAGFLAAARPDPDLVAFTAGSRALLKSASLL